MYPKTRKIVDGLAQGHQGMVATDKLPTPREAPFNLSAYLQERQAQVEAALDGAIQSPIQTRFMRRCATLC